MPPRIWPFKQKTSTPENEKAHNVALTFALGAEDSLNDYADSNPDGSLEYYADTLAQNPVVYSCIRELATSVSSIDFNAVIARDSGEYEDFDGPLGQLIRQPNPDWTTVDLIENITEQLLIYGNSYLFFKRAGVGGGNARIDEIHLLPPANVTIKAGSGEGSVNGIQSYQFQTSDTANIDISPADVAHIRLPNPTTGSKIGSLYGMSPLAVLKSDVILDAMLSDLSLNMLKRGAVPSGLLKLSRRVSSQEDANLVRARWQSTFSGKSGQFSTAILDSDTSYEPIQALPKDLALESTRFECVSRICGALGVPPIIVGTNLGLMRSTYSNYKQAQQSYMTETVQPLANRIERFLNLKLVPNFAGTDVIIKTDYSNTTAFTDAEDAKTKRIKSLFDSGIISLNEARQELSFDPIDAGDVRRTPNNILEVRVGDSVPVLSAPDPSKWLTSDAIKALEPSPEAQHPPLETHRTGPIPLPNSNQLIKEIRRNDTERIEKLAKDLERKWAKPLKNRINGILGRRLSESDIYTKEYPFTVDDLAPPEMGDELSVLLQVTALATLKSTYDNLKNSGLLPSMPLDERNRFAQRAIQEAGENGLRIHKTTTKGLSEILTFGLLHGLSVRDLADGGVLPDGTPFKGLRGYLQDVNKNRIPMIARTEISQMSNMSTLSYYNQMGADYVQLIDGDMFDEVCASRNNRIIEMDEASTLGLAHPNCILDFVPALDRGTRPDQLIARMGEPIAITKGIES